MGWEQATRKPHNVTSELLKYETQVDVVGSRWNEDICQLPVCAWYTQNAQKPSGPRRLEGAHILNGMLRSMQNSFSEHSSPEIFPVTIIACPSR